MNRDDLGYIKDEGSNLKVVNPTPNTVRETLLRLEELCLAVKARIEPTDF